MHLEIRCHFNVVALFSPYCIVEIDTWSAAICMHARTETHTNTAVHTWKDTHAHTERRHVDQPDLTRKIQHALQLWDSYWFLVHHLIDFAFLRLQIDGDSRGFLMGLNPGVCLAVSEGLSVLCALITHNCLSPAAAVFGGFVQRGYRGIKTRISPRDKDPSYHWVSFWRRFYECMIWFYLIWLNIQRCSLCKHH